ncbi:MAG: hypothetical protein AAF211_11575, partial [Myxococcota bacterium]
MRWVWLPLLFVGCLPLNRIGDPLGLVTTTSTADSGDETPPEDSGLVTDTVDTTATIDTGTEVPSPEYVMCTSTFGKNGASGSVISVPSLANDVVIDPSRTLDAGLGSPACQVVDRMLYLGSSEGSTITRFRIDDEGRFHEEDALSLAGFGVTSIVSRGLVVLSVERGYYVDSENWQIHRFDPGQMSVVDSIDIGTLAPSGTREGWLASVTLMGDTLVAAAGYTETADAVLDEETQVAVLDTTELSV